MRQVDVTAFSSHHRQNIGGLVTVGRIHFQLEWAWKLASKGYKVTCEWREMAALHGLPGPPEGCPCGDPDSGPCDVCAGYRKSPLPSFRDRLLHFLTAQPDISYPIEQYDDVDLSRFVSRMLRGACRCHLEIGDSLCPVHPSEDDECLTSSMVCPTQLARNGDTPTSSQHDTKPTTATVSTARDTTTER